MKHCNKCNKTWPEEFSLCPICGGELVMDNPQPAETVTMGDGNAINGGVTISKDESRKDDHSTSSSNNTTGSFNTNISNETIFNGPVTHVERDKTEEELKWERLGKYRKFCQEVCKDGILTRDEVSWLEEKRGELNLTQQDAEAVLNEVRNSQKKTVRTLNVPQKAQFDHFVKSIKVNNKEKATDLLPSIEIIARAVQHEELHFYYYMVLAAQDPELCAEKFNNKLDDNYWLTFWTYVAYYQMGESLQAEQIMAELSIKWQGVKPEENLVLLGCLGALIRNDRELANEIYTRGIAGKPSPVLMDLLDVVTSILFYDIENFNQGNILKQNIFYIDSFMHSFHQMQIESAKKMEEVRKAKKEEEENALKVARETIKQAETESQRLKTERERYLLEVEATKKQLEEKKRHCESEFKKLTSEQEIFVAKKRNFEKEQERANSDIKYQKQQLEDSKHRLNQDKQQFEQDKASFNTERQKFINERDAANANIQKERNCLKELKHQQEKERNDLNAESAKFQIERKNLEENLRKLNAEKDLFVNKKSAFDKDSERLNLDLIKQKQQLEESKRRFLDDKQKLDKDIESFREEKSKFIKERESSMVDSNNTEKRLSDMQKKLDKERNDLNAENKQLILQRKKLDEDLRQYHDLASACATVKTEYANLQHEYEQLTEQHDLRLQSIKEREDELSQTLQQRKNDLENENKKLEKTISELQRKAEQLKNEIGHLENQREHYCPQCRERVALGVRFCKKCGYEFVKK